MGATIISELLTEILIPVAAVVGIVFALVQWLLVSKVKLSPERQGGPPQGGKNGYGDYLIEEEEGLNDHNVVVKCAEIQSAISEGERDRSRKRESLRFESSSCGVFTRFERWFRGNLCGGFVLGLDLVVAEVNKKETFFFFSYCL